MDEVAKVAPLAGARIEIVLNGFLDVLGFVAPLAGARIEIMDELPLDLSPKVSLPSRERGLKYFCLHPDCLQSVVAPLAGAWIEMLVGAVPGHKANRRSPCGSVD